MIMKHEDARAAILEQVPPPRVASVSLAQTRNLVVAEDIIAKEAVPNQDFASVSGYAVRSEDTKGATKEFPVAAKMVGRCKAGQIYRHRLDKNEVVFVDSGALLPPGADTVMLPDDVDRVGKELKIYRKMGRGENIRHKGGDVAPAECVLRKGRRIRSQEIALLSAIGSSTIRVYPKPDVALLVTGAEQASLGKRRKPSQVWNSLTPMLTAMVEESGSVVIDLGWARERHWFLRRKIAEGLRYPVLIIAGGIFVRNYDLAKDVMDRLHVREIFWRVNIRPGRPLYFGRSKNTLVFGLPDTAGAAFVDFEEFVRPALLKLMGRERLRRREITAVVGTDLRNHSGRTFFVRSFLRRNGRNVTVFPSGNQHSHIVKTLSRSNALIAMDEEQGFIRRGERVKVRVLD